MNKVTYRERIRAHIELTTNDDISKFMAVMAGLEDAYSIEDFEGVQRANAKSTLGVMYAASDYGSQLYLVNDTNDGQFPAALDCFRVQA